MMSNILIISQNDMSAMLAQGNVQVANQVVDLTEYTFAKFTSGQEDEHKAIEAQSPQRISVHMDSHQVLVMPSRLGQTTSVKVVSVPTKEGLSGLHSTIMVIDETTGSVEALMNADALTAVRTAAGSGLATRYYANPNAKHLVVFGAGAQGRSHVDMMIAVRPSLQRIAIWNRSEKRRLALIEELKKTYPDRTFVSANEDLENEVRGADIICTCTNATEPVLFGEWLKPGVHLNCVGSYRMDMHEVDTETIKKAQLIVVDSVNACGHEAGELVKSSTPEDWLEIGHVKLKNINTDQDREKTTLFKSVGISVQDSAVSGFIVQRAKQENLGTSVPF